MVLKSSFPGFWSNRILDQDFFVKNYLLTKTELTKYVSQIGPVQKIGYTLSHTLIHTHIQTNNIVMLKYRDLWLRISYCTA